MQEEIWKDVIGYEGLYHVSNLGNIKSFNCSKEKILKKTINGRGYYVVGLYKNKKSKKFSIHQLIAITFLNHIPNGNKFVVDHINDNKLDNRLENLQIITQRENVYKNKNNLTSAFQGVCWDKSKNKWLSRISINKKVNFIGYFNREIDAHLAYQNHRKLC